MAHSPYSQSASSSPLPQHQQPNSLHNSPHLNTPSQRHTSSKQRFCNDLSRCLYDFVIQLLPTTEEMAVKEDVRKLLERLIRTIEPDSRLLSFGSTGNGFALRNSDMDLCCLIDSEERLAASDLVTMLGDLLDRETKFHVKPLPHARIPIVKLSLDPSPGLPLGIACDIGFENRLALENTRLLMCYAMIDPTRVRTIVLFLKVWSKRRKINSPYKGTLSSYGYVLLVLYFLIHVKNPPVLPNLQQMPPLRPISEEDTHLAGYNTWFFDDIELLRQRWQSPNQESVAELLIDFFRYFSRDFTYNTGVASIRAGLIKKDIKGWQNELFGAKFHDSRERNRLCIEDPFETDFNVARCVTKDGLYTIRGELMRAARILAVRPERAIVALAELCEERKDDVLVPAPPFAPRASLPPQTPYTVGSQSMRPKGTPAVERLSPPTQFFESGPSGSVRVVSTPQPPEHMVSRRSKWTSPPPPEASSADHMLFEDKLELALENATTSTSARQQETGYTSSSSNSEVITDDEQVSDIGDLDDVMSVRSLTEDSRSSPLLADRRLSRASDIESSSDAGYRGRHSLRNGESGSEHSVVPTRLNSGLPPSSSAPSSSKVEYSRRSISGPPRALNGFTWPLNAYAAMNTPLPPSPNPDSEPATVFYQTAARSPRPTALHSTRGTPSPLLTTFDRRQYHPDPSSSSQNTTNLSTPLASDFSHIRAASGGLSTPTPSSYFQTSHHTPSVSSASTITAFSPSTSTQHSSPVVSRYSPNYLSLSRSSSPYNLPEPQPPLLGTTNGGPATTSIPSGYTTSPSFSSPTPPPPPLITPAARKHGHHHSRPRQNGQTPPSARSSDKRNKNSGATNGKLTTVD